MPHHIHFLVLWGDSVCMSVCVCEHTTIIDACIWHEAYVQSHCMLPQIRTCTLSSRPEGKVPGIKCSVPKVGIICSENVWNERAPKQEIHFVSGHQDIESKGHWPTRIPQCRHTEQTWMKEQKQNESTERNVSTHEVQTKNQRKHIDELLYSLPIPFSHLTIVSSSIFGLALFGRKHYHLPSEGEHKARYKQWVWKTFTIHKYMTELEVGSGIATETGGGRQWCRKIKSTSALEKGWEKIQKWQKNQ